MQLPANPLRIFILILLCYALTGCAIERAQKANAAKASMIGMQKSEVLACMGVPQSQSTVGDVEVWSYESGNGHTDNSMFVASNSTSNLNIARTSAFGTRQTNSIGAGTTTRRSCTINIVMQNEKVSKVNYSGPTGGLFTKGEQCAYVIENCVN
jgi:hypothetical protein